MPRDANGSYSLPSGTLVNSGDTIMPSQHNPAMEDIASSMTGSFSRDGLGAMRANANFGGFRAVNMAPGVAPADGATMAQVTGAGLPIGAPSFWFMPTPPAGWLLAFGQEVSRTAYSDLFAIYGTFFGNGDGSTTFNLPDCRGVAFVGLDNMGGAARNLLPAATTVGNVIGSASVTLTTGQLPSHTHTGTTNSSGAHTHPSRTATSIGSNVGATFEEGQGGTAWNTAAQTASAGAHTHTFTTGSSGSGQAHPNVQPSFPCYVIIKAQN